MHTNTYAHTLAHSLSLFRTNRHTHTHTYTHTHFKDKNDRKRSASDPFYNHIG